VSVWWSVGLSAIAITNSWLIGNRWTPAWIIAALYQCLWATYAVATAQWGFVASAIIFGTMSVRNYRKWKRLDREEAARDDVQQRVRDRV
jgi:hypothetical protein